MAQNSVFNDRTLFHLVPVPGCRLAEDALSHPDNRRFVSPSADGRLGLEIGFHVPKVSRGPVIVRLGRNTDLILRRSLSGVHFAFEIHPETCVVLLCNRTKYDSSITVAPEARGRVGRRYEEVTYGDCAILYGQGYAINVRAEGTESYEFELSDQATRLKDVESRDQSIQLRSASTAHSWYRTRIRTAKAPIVTESEGSRIHIGAGGFGTVYSAIDRTTGNPFAVKVVDLAKDKRGIEQARSALNREVTIMQELDHVNIIECLGASDFQTSKPVIYMPMREGSLESLVGKGKASPVICDQVLVQMLRALDYLDYKGYCHRDLKPPNILYQSKGQNEYHFQLADFGLANHWENAASFCGTNRYLAPELYCGHLHEQSPKMDIWALFITLAEMAPNCDFAPRSVHHRPVVAQAVKTAAAQLPPLEPMTRTDPKLRASAAQMLLVLFNDVPAPQPPDERLDSQAASRLAPPRIIQYPVRRHQQKQRPRPAPSPGILPNRLPPPTQQPIRVQRDGIRKQAAPQAKPQARLREAQAERFEPQPRVLSRRPREREPPVATRLPRETELPEQPTQPEKKQRHTRRGANPDHKPSRAQFENLSEILTPNLPGMFPRE
ncbi:kinase-like protein [Xylariaceae sp. FL0594]|nr:kinase-like protein [Xylariaceae sp. FL0594]